MTKYFKITNLEELKTRYFYFKCIKREESKRTEKIKEENNNDKR
mgnify:FL=1